VTPGLFWLGMGLGLAAALGGLTAMLCRNGRAAGCIVAGAVLLLWSLL
jgi:hypothetical protein